MMNSFEDIFGYEISGWEDPLGTVPQSEMLEQGPNWFLGGEDLHPHIEFDVEKRTEVEDAGFTGTEEDFFNYLFQSTPINNDNNNNYSSSSNSSRSNNMDDFEGIDLLPLEPTDQLQQHQPSQNLNIDTLALDSDPLALEGGYPVVIELPELSQGVTVTEQEQERGETADRPSTWIPVKSVAEISGGKLGRPRREASRRPRYVTVLPKPPKIDLPVVDEAKAKASRKRQRRYSGGSEEHEGGEQRKEVNRRAAAKYREKIKKQRVGMEEEEDRLMEENAALQERYDRLLIAVEKMEEVLYMKKHLLSNN